MFTYQDYSSGMKQIITITDQKIKELSDKIELFLKGQSDYIDDGAIHKNIFRFDIDFNDYPATLKVLQIMKKQRRVEAIPLGWNDFAWKLV
jgi:hypothetical protein